MTEATIDSQLSLEPVREERAADEAAPVPPVSDTAKSWVDETASEVARLEELLRERASELQTQKARARKAEALVRDLMAQLEAAARLTLPADDASSLRARTLEAEIGRAEIQLRFDELLGHFTTLSERDASRAQLEAAQAELIGRERELRGALAEAEEARDIAFARATLLDHDLTLMRDARSDLIRELAEAREQLELSTAQRLAVTSRFEHGLPTDEAEAARGEIAGLRSRLDEQSRAAELAATLLAAARADGQEQRRLLGSVRVELSARQADHREALSRAEQLERELARERDRLRELAAQNAKLSEENAGVREELASALSNATLLRNALRVLEEDASAANREIGSARTSAVSAAQRSADLSQAVCSARQALVSVQAQLQRVLQEGAAGATPDPTEPGTPLSFDEIEGEP